MGDWLQFGTSSWLAASGTVWDIAGAILLARGYLWATDEGIRREKASAWGMNPGAARAAAEERRNQRFGLSLIIVGFLLQAISNCGVTTSQTGAIAMVILLAPVLWIYATTFQYVTVRDGLRISFSPTGYERVWRKHHNDVPDRIWYAILWNEGLQFAKEPEDNLP